MRIGSYSLASIAINKGKSRIHMDALKHVQTAWLGWHGAQCWWHSNATYMCYNEKQHQNYKSSQPNSTSGYFSHIPNELSQSWDVLERVFRDLCCNCSFWWLDSPDIQSI